MHHPDEAPRPIRVAIVEDRREIRESLALLINGTEGYQTAGVFRTMEEAMRDIGSQAADVALVDIGLPGLSGIEGIRVLKERYPAIQYLVLSVYEDDERIFEAMCAGASGYLLKKTSPAKLIESIGEVLNGGAPMSPEVARRVVRLFRDVCPPVRVEHQLSAQEVRLLKLLGQGHYYKSAAAEMGITVHTVSFHLRSIYEKLQVHSKSEAVAKALRAGIIC